MPPSYLGGVQRSFPFPRCSISPEPSVFWGQWDLRPCLEVGRQCSWEITAQMWGLVCPLQGQQEEGAVTVEKSQGTGKRASASTARPVLAPDRGGGPPTLRAALGGSSGLPEKAGALAPRTANSPVASDCQSPPLGRAAGQACSHVGPRHPALNQRVPGPEQRPRGWRRQAAGLWSEARRWPRGAAAVDPGSAASGPGGPGVEG